MLKLDNSICTAVDTLATFKGEAEKSNVGELKAIATKVKVFLSSYPTFSNHILNTSLNVFPNADHHEQVRRIVGVIDGAIPVFQSGQPFFHQRSEPVVNNNVQSTSSSNSSVNADIKIAVEVLKGDLNIAVSELDEEQAKKNSDSSRVLDAALKVVKIVKAIAALGLFT